MAVEATVGVSDLVAAELVECQPEPRATESCVPVPVAPEVSPANRIREASIEQVGADPPPVVRR